MSKTDFDFSNLAAGGLTEIIKTGDERTRAMLRAAVRRNLYFAVKTVTCYAFHTTLKPNLMTADGFKESCDWLQWVISTKKRGLFEDPRAHLKSFRSTITLPWWLATQMPNEERDDPREYDRAMEYINAHPHMRGPDNRIGIASESKKIATRWNAAGKEQWLSNPILRWLFPEYVWPNPNKPGYGSFSNEAYFLPGRSDPTESNPYSRSIGLDSKEAGGRCDFILVDDLVSEGSSQSPTELARRWDWFRSISQLLENSDYSEPSGGVVMLTENRWALDDPNTRVHKELDHYAIWRRSAYRCYVHGSGNCGRWTGDEEEYACTETEDGIWPERYPDLDKIRIDKGDRIFDIQWRNNPIAHPELDVENLSTFNLEVQNIATPHGARRGWVVVIPEARATDTGEVLNKYESFPLAHLSHHYLSIDPASADKESVARMQGKTARSCMSWFALDRPTGRVFNIDLAAGHFDPDTAIQEFFKLWVSSCEQLGYSPKILCEKVAAQVFVAKALKFYVQARSDCKWKLPEVEMIPRATGIAKDPRIRARVGWRLSQGRLYIRSGLNLPRNEIRHFPTGSKDWLDTLAQVEEIYLEVHGAANHGTAGRSRRKRQRAHITAAAGRAGAM